MWATDTISPSTAAPGKAGGCKGSSRTIPEQQTLPRAQNRSEQVGAAVEHQLVTAPPGACWALALWASSSGPWPREPARHGRGSSRAQSRGCSTARPC